MAARHGGEDCRQPLAGVKLSMPLFTVETAREAQRKAAESRRANRVAGGQEQPQQPQSSAPNPPPDGFLSERLTRVRAQMERIEAMWTSENDAKTLDQLASAYSRLAERERLFRGEPLPGSLRPPANPARPSAGLELD